MNTRPMSRTGHRLSFALLALAATQCGGPSRFALRQPLVHDDDNRPLAHMPAPSDESEVANAIDVTTLRPLSHAFLFEQSHEARNVNALDEVPNSTWFTNRTVTADQLVRGPCPDEGPTLPFTIRRTKTGGVTSGFIARDARGITYMVKLDAAQHQQYEMSTAGDSIAPRLYWAVGFNAPCNDVVFIRNEDLRLTPESYEALNTGERRPLTELRLAQVLALATPGPSGTIRLSASRFIDGEHLGTWRTEGTRNDDANDIIPHEDRRELRGERFLAAWVGHWDSRGPNTYDAFVPSPSGEGGYVVHYFLDFGDTLGGSPAYGDGRPEPRATLGGVSNALQIAEDIVAFGFVRRTWDTVSLDPQYPNLGYFDVTHFDPLSFSPQTPLVRWVRADRADLAWMARKLAPLGVEHVRNAVHAGRLSNPDEESRLVDILMGRRDRILRAAFALASPIADVAVSGTDHVCAVDLATSLGMSDPAHVSYAMTFREGARGVVSPVAPALGEGRPERPLCIVLPPHFAPESARDDSADRYAILSLVRDDGRRRTEMRVHFYDLGPQRGYVLVGIERL